MPADPMMATTREAPGYYGKLPARGDFLGRRLGREFVEEWDSWLQQAITASREALGERWPEYYLVSPLWRFILSTAACGPNTVAGVMMPSVDSVHRCFPLMLGREFEPNIDFSDFLSGTADWYDTIEKLALSALATEFDLKTFDRPIELHASAKPDLRTRLNVKAPPHQHIAFDTSDPERLAAVVGSYRMGLMPTTFWWTSGSEHVAPCLLVCPGMPQPESFVSFLNGNWQSAGWLSHQSPPVT
jgi:type VI secretion system protein ImpM